MEKTIYDESNGLWYELRGDYYLPCLTVPTQEERPSGIWGHRHLRYIKQERKVLYTELKSLRMVQVCLELFAIFDTRLVNSSFSPENTFQNSSVH